MIYVKAEYSLISNMIDSKSVFVVTVGIGMFANPVLVCCTCLGNEVLGMISHKHDRLQMLVCCGKRMFAALVLECRTCLGVICSPQSQA
ncbi:hypothetical protein TIFTF001_007099 [Ficus carica]|uniref:Uncharacterized protein n=1 Tax=Ficus carica TaxID=3494 RepID=A0AA87ZQV5_FICCA|nr:hypothetical protein TIFTF001_007099 [Ficus carica]